MNVCRICENSHNNEVYTAREMLFGFRDEFEYFQCSSCGCLQVKEVPNNLGKYYPDGYYSFSLPRFPKSFFLPTFLILTSYLRRQRLLYALGEENTIGLWLSKIFNLPHLRSWVKRVKLEPDSRILDVGCGGGKLLRRLVKKGFSDLTGVDPFIEDDIFYKSGVRVFKKEIKDVEGQFDFIMLDHSFEHMPDPLSVLKKTYDILGPDRYVLIRIPVVSSFAWEEYKTNWVQLDAPRHLFLHSVRSIEILAERAGFKVEEIVFDSEPFQFWASEQYIRDIPLMDARSYSKNKSDSIFSDEQMKSFEAKAKELNRSGKGDQACFYLYKE